MREAFNSPAWTRMLLAAVCVSLTVACGPREAPVVSPGGTAAADAAGAAYDGTWTGSWVRQECQEKGGAVGKACQALPERQGLQLQLTQDGNRVRGQLDLGTLRTAVNGSVERGSLRLSGRGEGGEQTLEVKDWRTTLAAGAMDGSFVLIISAADEQFGTVSMTARLENVVKSSSGR